MNFKNYNPRNLKVLTKEFFKKIYLKSKLFFNYIKFCINKFQKFSKIKIFPVFVFFFAVFLFYFILIAPPRHFPVGSIINIEEGTSLTEIAISLKEQNVIKSALVFKSLVRLIDDKGVMAGDYFFVKDYPVFRIVWKTIKGDCGITPTRVVIIEGFTIFDIADTMKKNFPNFNNEKFIKLAEKEEGYLFPDTYYFLSSITPEGAIKTMKENFNLRIEEIALEIEGFGKTLEEIVIMASLLEKEARTLKSKQKIAGILWKRIDIGMPLQVDAVFPYIIGKNTYEVSLEDLKVDSPYNTYANKGLPIGPIANPSIYSLLAAATPIESDYLFYLSDRAGNMYYAEDFEGHKQNRWLYMD